MKLVNGLYYRISLSDGDLGKDYKDESNSIDNQRMLLKDFLEKHKEELGEEYKEYIDDGYTGTNFERPAFKQMIEDAKAGRVDTIIVKDFSRLGRDYIGVGDYLEQIFPLLGIRFIAVNNSYDSGDEKNVGNTPGMDMAISNLINSFYSKDLSKKMKSALKVRWKQGKCTNGRAVFGYKRENGNREWSIDPVSSKYVRLIFDLAIAGKETQEIAYILNESEIPTPGKYARMTGRKNAQGGRHFVPDKEVLWNSNIVCSILNRLEYTGAMVQGKRETLVVGSKATRKCSENDRIVIKGVHPAIVTEKEYEEANSVIVRANRSKYKGKNNHLLRGKVRCGNCLRVLQLIPGIEDKLVCTHKKAVGEFSECSGEDYPRKIVEGMVWYLTKQQIQLAKEVQDQRLCMEKELKNKARKKVINLESELGILKAERMRQYEAYAEGIISKEIYLKKKSEITKKVTLMEQELENVGWDTEKEKLIEGDIEKELDHLSKFTGKKSMTRNMVEELIDTIYVYDSKRIEVRFQFEDTLKKAVEKYGRAIEEREETA